MQLLLVVLGAVLALGGSIYVGWRGRVRDRRTEILLGALPAAIDSVANVARGIDSSMAEIDQLRRLAIVASRGDDLHVRKVVAHVNEWKDNEPPSRPDGMGGRLAADDWREKHEAATKSALGDLLEYQKWLANRLRQGRWPIRK